MELRDAGFFTISGGDSSGDVSVSITADSSVTEAETFDMTLDLRMSTDLDCGETKVSERRKRRIEDA